MAINMGDYFKQMGKGGDMMKKVEQPCARFMIFVFPRAYAS